MDTKGFLTSAALIAALTTLTACSCGGGGNGGKTAAGDGSGESTAQYSGGNGAAEQTELSPEEQAANERKKYGLPQEGEMPDETNLYFKKKDESEYLQLHMFHDSYGSPVCHLYAWNGTVFKSNMPMEEDQLHWYFKRHFDNGYDFLCVVAKDWTSICYEGTMYNFLATRQEYEEYCKWVSKPGNHIELQHPQVAASAPASSAYEEDDYYDRPSRSSRQTPTYRDRKVYRPNMTGDDDRAWCEQCQTWDMPHGHYRERSN